jgi:predicted RNA-binding Zn-ribbon protein involved in translation (DUF1610 family)
MGKGAKKRWKAVVEIATSVCSRRQATWLTIAVMCIFATVLYVSVYDTALICKRMGLWITIYDGRVTLVVWDRTREDARSHRSAPYGLFVFPSREVVRYTDNIGPLNRHLTRIAGPVPGPVVWSVSLSVGWLIAGAIIAVIARPLVSMFIRMRAYIRNQAGRCANCGYDLSSHRATAVCPECGSSRRSRPAGTQMNIDQAV